MLIKNFINEFVLLFTAIKDGIVFLFVTLPSTLFSMLKKKPSKKEIAKEKITGDYHKIDTSYGNLLSVLKGTKVLKFDKEISGSVLAATYGNDSFIQNVPIDNTKILIIGDRKTILNYAISNKVKLIILIGNAKISNELLNKAKANRVNIISTN